MRIPVLGDLHREFVHLKLPEVAADVVVLSLKHPGSAIGRPSDARASPV